MSHRHILFTILEELRLFFCHDRTLLSKLAKAINEVMKYQFHNIHKKSKENLKFLNLLLIILPTPIFFIMNLSLLFILLVEI